MRCLRTGSETWHNQSRRLSYKSHPCCSFYPCWTLARALLSLHGGQRNGLAKAPANFIWITTFRCFCCSLCQLARVDKQSHLDESTSSSVISKGLQELTNTGSPGYFQKVGERITGRVQLPTNVDRNHLLAWPTNLEY